MMRQNYKSFSKNSLFLFFLRNFILEKQIFSCTFACQKKVIRSNTHYIMYSHDQRPKTVFPLRLHIVGDRNRSFANNFFYSFCNKKFSFTYKQYCSCVDGDMFIPSLGDEDRNGQTQSVQQDFYVANHP